MQNDDAASYNGQDVESANEIHSDSEFEDVVEMNHPPATEVNLPIDTTNTIAENKTDIMV